ncbi:MAG: hypothetical protein BWX70_03033 [Verrucomicrobia bacterium ADurb.Bin070]|nr:MAG: hypothetical protein BWX70_03033 [Verrucomicrobia bacterium ADurb.Bin070]
MQGLARPAAHQRAQERHRQQDQRKAEQHQHQGFQHVILDGEIDHIPDRHNNFKRRAAEVRQRVRDHMVHLLRVAGAAAHQLPDVGPPEKVKPLGLQVAEHGHAEILHHLGTGPAQKIVVHVHRDHLQQHHQRHHEERQQQQLAGHVALRVAEGNTQAVGIGLRLAEPGGQSDFAFAGGRCGGVLLDQLLQAFVERDVRRSMVCGRGLRGSGHNPVALLVGPLHLLQDRLNDLKDRHPRTGRDGAGQQAGQQASAVFTGILIEASIRFPCRVLSVKKIRHTYPCAVRNRSASSAAMQPDPAAVTACL